LSTGTEVVPSDAGIAAHLRSRGVSGTILRLAWPVVVERMSISVLSAVDAALVGHYVGADGVAAIGIGALMFWVPLAGALAIEVGATAVIARDAGAGDTARAQHGVHAALVAGLLWGFACTALIFAFAPQIMRLMGARPEVVPLGVDYLRAGAIAFPMLTALYTVSGAFRGMGNTWITMLILIVVNAVNALVTFLLISGVVADLGVQASGIGYASASVAGGLIALAIAASPRAPLRIAPLRLLNGAREDYARLFRIGLPVGLEETQFMFAFLVYTRIIARLGTDQLAAHSLAMRSVEIALLPAFALGTSATALVGRYLGAGDPDTAEAVAKRTRFFAICALTAMAAAQFAFAPLIVRAFVSDQEVVDTGTKLLRVFAFALPALAIHGSLSGALRGAGDVRFVLGTFTFTAWGIRVPLAALLVIGFGLSAPFAWLAALSENWVRAALVLLRFRTGKWKTMRV